MPSAPTTRLPRAESRARIVAAATDLLRDSSYAEMNVGRVMRRAGIERTIFYRHFDGLADVLVAAGSDSVESLYEAQVDLGETRDGSGEHPEAIRAAIERVVSFYARNGPVLRALGEAAASEERVASGQRELRDRFDELTTAALTELPQFEGMPRAEVHEIARSLNLMNNAYLLDAYGRGPKVPETTAVRTLTTVWTGVIYGPRPASM